MHSLSGSCTFLLATMLALPAGAGTDNTSPGGGAQPGRDAPQLAMPPATLAQPDDALFGAAATDELLARARGGSDLTTIDTTLTGTVSGNSANSVTSGANIIQGGSFANMAGIPIVVQNSGANVLIQNATVINLQFK
jgi:hypothetical protein